MVLEKWRPRREVRPWSPFRELDDLERRFEEMFGRRLLPGMWWQTEEERWMPAIDMFEKEDKFVVKAELPGMKKEEIDVSIAGDTLTIKGEKKTEAETREENYYRSERAYGSFFRSIPIPASVDSNKIEANYEDGVLEITMPKGAEVKPKKVPIATKESTV